MDVCVIAPRLPPAVDGLGDYCRRLWESWPGAPPSWAFLVADGAEASRARWPEVRIEAIAAGGLARQLDSVGASTVALQYVGYGYHPTGSPAWLPEALAAWRRVAPGRRLVVMFHELWATGPIWRRAFWTHPAQVRIAVALAQEAAAVFASTPLTQRLISERAGIAARFLPVPSNIRVSFPCGRDLLPERVRVFVFGQAPVRARALHLHAPLLQALARSGRLGELVLAGAGLAAGDEAAPEAVHAARLVGRARLRVRGELAEEGLSEALGACELSLVATPPHLVGKSGTAMAALAHGCAIVLAGREDPAPLVDGEEVLRHDGTAANAARLAESLTAERARRVGEGGRRWYEANAAWPIVAGAWREHLG